MALITINELYKAQDSYKYNFGKVQPDQEYRAGILRADVEKNQFGGTSLNLIYEFLDDNNQSLDRHIRAFVTYADSLGRPSKEFAKFIAKFFDLSKRETIDTDDLKGSICQIKVIDQVGSDWQKVVNVVPVIVQGKPVEVAQS